MRSIRPSILQLLKKEHRELNEQDYISIRELNEYREKYISEYLTQQLGELTELEKTVLETLAQKTTLTSKVDAEEDTAISRGQQLADSVAHFGGSWTFIVLFFLFIGCWIVVNMIILNKYQSLDPYPFILLNLLLSFVAALQAPLIMMSQRRLEEKDRERAKKDYMINLKSELEIRILHEKIDHLIVHQQQQLLEIQKVQIEMINDILQQITMKA
ncbi:MAG: DUF1003 domain-containing protein [Ferruginibacter sp.]